MYPPIVLNWLLIPIAPPRKLVLVLTPNASKEESTTLPNRVLLITCFNLPSIPAIVASARCLNCLIVGMFCCPLLILSKKPKFIGLLVETEAEFGGGGALVMPLTNIPLEGD